jgi:hypothetical protein
MDAVVQPPIEASWVQSSLCAVIGFAAPHKALEKQKRYLRRYCRKPKDMTIRVFVNHLMRINYTEMCLLPPSYSARQCLPDDEMVDIIVNSIPRKWIREMDRLDFDPATKNTNEVVHFCERMESAEESEEGNKKAPTKHASSSTKKGKTEGAARKDCNCMFHGPNTHPTSECKVVQSMVASTKKNNGNKSWSRKANDNKTKARQEINAFVQKQVQKGIAKAAANPTKKCTVKSYANDKELDAMLAEYDYDDLENLVANDEAVDGGSISSDNDEAEEISVASETSS